MPRLIALRDELWRKDPDFLRSTLHGPSQTLVNLMRRQKRPSERHHTAGTSFLFGVSARTLPRLIILTAPVE